MKKLLPYAVGIFYLIMLPLMWKLKNIYLDYLGLNTDLFNVVYLIIVSLMLCYTLGLLVFFISDNEND